MFYYYYYPMNHFYFIFSLSMMCFPGTIPGPLMMGVAFDNTCVLWQPLQSCDGDQDATGSCLYYDNKALSTNFLILAVSVKAISFVAMVLAVILYKPPRIVADDLIAEVKTEKQLDTGDTGDNQIDEQSKTKPAEIPNGGFHLEDEIEAETSQL